MNTNNTNSLLMYTLNYNKPTNYVFQSISISNINMNIEIILFAHNSKRKNSIHSSLVSNKNIELNNNKLKK